MQELALAADEFIKGEIVFDDTEKALLNILDDYSEEKNNSENTQRALLNILDDISVEKKHSDDTQKALLNILDDFHVEKTHSENTQKALLNILDDFHDEKSHSDNTQKALLNILDDFHEERQNSENTQRALLNILDDYKIEKEHMEETQRAFLNILEDYSDEKKKAESISEDLIIANKENKELEQFAFVASHDLQEPLRTITNFVGLLNRTYEGKGDASVTQYLNYIVTATSKMQNLIKDLLDLSRIGTNTVFKEVNFNTLLEALIADLDSAIKESKVNITISPLPVLFGIETELRRLFLNLLSNAIKFRRKDVPLEIKISVEERLHDWLFAIKDNGIGIEEQYKEKIFIIFQRLHTTEQYPGTGIGLATCKKIVALHNGRIRVDSIYGEGSTFYIILPKQLHK